jgi:hypothetical protein
MHAPVRWVRYRQLIPLEHSEWSDPVESEAATPISVVSMEAGTRDDLWPNESHLGLPMLLPGGEVGRLLAFEQAEDGSTWRYSLEFRGAREG